MRTKHGLGILLALAGSLFVSQQAVALGYFPPIWKRRSKLTWISKRKRG